MVKELHDKFGSQLEIMCFPSDEFGGQELATGEEIVEFVGSLGLPTQDEPGLHLMAKVNVNGASAHPIWKLAKQAYPGEIRWNFQGIFLFDKNGACVKRADMKAPPTAADIQRLL